MVCSIDSAKEGEQKRTMKPLLSIIIVNYNTGKLLMHCISSIEKSDLSFPYEVIVIDNASTDGSATPKSASATGQAGIKRIENKRNVGFAKAVNQGIKAAKGKYALLLNPDTEVQVGTIAKVLEFAKHTPNAGVVGAKFLNLDGSPQGSVFPPSTIWNAVQEFWLGRKTYSKYVPQGKSPVAVDAVSGAVFLITPQARERVGLLDERYFMYFEDLDYCRRVKRAGLKIYYLPSAHVVHYHGVSGRRILGQGDQWRRLIPGSKTYNGVVKHTMLSLIIWSGQKWQKFLHRE